RQAPHALAHPRRLAELFEILAHSRERTEHVEVVDADELAPAGVEEDELAEREQLQRSAELRFDSPSRPRHPSDLAVLPGEERHDPAALPQRESAAYTRRRFAERHRRSSAGTLITVPP